MGHLFFFVESKINMSWLNKQATDKPTKVKKAEPPMDLATKLFLYTL